MTTSQNRPRRRVRVAEAVLRRVAAQRQAFATAYAAATTPQARFNAAATALRAAASERNQRGDPDTTRQLDDLTARMTALLDQLHNHQERRADRVLRGDARRIARNERNRNDRSRADSGRGAAA